MQSQLVKKIWDEWCMIKFNELTKSPGPRAQIPGIVIQTSQRKDAIQKHKSIIHMHQKRVRQSMLQPMMEGQKIVKRKNGTGKDLKKAITMHESHYNT